MSRARPSACGTFAAGLFLAVLPARAQPGPVVNTPAGAIQGESQGTLNVFKGLRYAEPPVGAARWTPPKPLPHWQGVRAATRFGPACVQPSGFLDQVYSRPPMPMSEDCLTLNVWAPKDARHAPVFFWIHGGALTSGASRDALFDGAKIAERGIVFVSINVRLGVLGYLAHPQLSAESPQGVSGNYGLLDEIEALRWVHRNIAAFGGDPSNVTIAGESSGALSVLYLMASPPARGLFAKAIAESGYLITSAELKMPAHGLPSAEAIGLDLTKTLHASSVAELRVMDALALTEAAATHYSPLGTVDGRILPRQLVDTFDRGEEARVPLLAGFNSGEVRTLGVLVPKTPASPADYQREVRARYGDLTDAFLKRYPANDLKQSILAASRDGFFGWTAERLMIRQTALGVPAYLYFWDHGYSAMDQRDIHAFHASELPYVFGDFAKAPPDWPRPPEDAENIRLSDAVISYWTSFARTGQPTASGEPAWPPYDATKAYMRFGAEPVASTDLLPGMYALHEEVVCRRRAAGDQPWNINTGLWSQSLPPLAPGCR